MSLLDKIFRPKDAKKSEDALNEARSFFKTLTAYAPVFTNFGGAIYESEIVRAAIDARARHISKLKVGESVITIKVDARTESVANMVAILISCVNDSGYQQHGVHRSGI